MPFPPSKAYNFSQRQSTTGFNTSYQQARNARADREYKLARQKAAKAGVFTQTDYGAASKKFRATYQTWSKIKNATEWEIFRKRQREKSGNDPGEYSPEIVSLNLDYSQQLGSLASGIQLYREQDPEFAQMMTHNYAMVAEDYKRKLKQLRAGR